MNARSLPPGPLLVLIALATGASAVPRPAAAADSPTCAVPLLSLDATGRATAGSKGAVHAAALRGDPLRIGWRLQVGARPDEALVHWADATFVTTFEGETFAQVAPIHRQHPVRAKAHIELSGEMTTWSASFGTNGKMVHRYGDGTAPKETTIAQTWCLAGEAAARCTTPSWRVLYRHDAQGKRLAGSKEDLLRAVRRGDPVRLAWGMSAAKGTVSVEHAADPVFVTIAGGREVYAQLAPHGKQRTYHVPGNAGLEEPALVWRAVMGTDGTFDAVWLDAADGDPAQRWPQRAGSTWLAYAPDPTCDPRAVPALAVPDGVRAVPTRP